MSRSQKFAACAFVISALISCAAAAKKPLVDPFPLRFPLVEAARIAIDGHIAGQPRMRDGILYYATREGWLTAFVVPSRAVLWRFRADHPVSAGPDLGEEHIFLRDGGGALYVLGRDGTLVKKRPPEGPIATRVGERSGLIVFASPAGVIKGFRGSDISDGRPLWEFQPPAAVTAGPVFTDLPLVLFGDASGRLQAFDLAGKPVWTFAGRGAVTAEPAVFGGRVYFGTDARMFYCLDAKKGRKKWSRRLQGAPTQPAWVSGRRVVVAASNSVVYFLSRRGGSIVSWEPVASRLLHEPADAPPFVLVTSAAPGLKALDRLTGVKAEEGPTAGLVAAGAVWSPPFVILFEEDPESGEQALVLLVHKSRP
jgi:outer membrane protein assembly factor BamB